MPHLQHAPVTRLDRRNQGAPWRGPTRPTHPTIKGGGSIPPPCAHRARPAGLFRDFSRLAGLVGQVGHYLENQRVVSPNLVWCPWQVGRAPRRGGIATLLTNAHCFEIMKKALREPVRLQCGADLERVRQRFYRVRQHCLAQGNHRFVILRFQIEGSSLVISRHPDPGLRWHRHKLRVLRELRAFVVEYGTGLGQPISEITGAENSEGDEQ